MASCSHTMRVKGRDGVTRCGDCGKVLPAQRTKPAIPPAASAPSPTIDEGMREAVAQMMFESAVSDLDLDWTWANALDGERSEWRRLAEAVLSTGPIASALAARERERDEARAVQQAMLIQIGDLARARGEAEGALAISEKAGIVEGWRDRALTAEAERDEARRAVDDVRTAMIQKHQTAMRLLDASQAENATLRASAERMEADHAEEIARLTAALEPFAKLGFSFDGFSFDPAELVVLGRCCGSFNSKEHSHLQTAIDAARAALTPKEPDHG